MSEIKEKINKELEPLEDICKKLVDRTKHSMDNMDDVDTEEMGEVIDMIYDMCKAKKEVVEACYKKQIMEAMEEYEDDFMETWDEDGPITKKGYRGQPRSKTSGRFMSRGDGRRSYTPKMPMDYSMDVDDYRKMTPEEMRDMDKHMGRMYYSGGNSSNGGSMGGNSMSYTDGYNDGNRRGYSDGYERGYSDGRTSTGNVIPNNSMSRDKREGRSGMARKRFFESKEKGNDTESMKSVDEFTRALFNEDMVEVVAKMTPTEKNMLIKRTEEFLKRAREM